VTRPLSVAIVCYPTYGGSGIVATELGKGLAARGVTVHFVCYEPPRRLLPIPAGVTYHPVKVVSYPLFRFPPYTLSLSAALLELIEGERPDIIHCHYAIPHAMSAWLSTTIASPPHPALITTLHGTDIELARQDPSFRRMIAHSLVKSDGITAVSAALARETEEGFPEITGRITTIPNFVDTSLFHPGRDPRIRARFASPSEFLLVHCSNFRPLKRIGDVVSTFAAVSARVPARLLLIGDGPDLPRAREHARDLGILDRVCFQREVRKMQHYLPLGDLFLLPSERESFGLAALEAMACGLPVIASDTGGLSEVVLEGVTGYLHPIGDTATAAARALAVLDNPGLRRAMSEASRERAATRFSIAAGIDAYLHFYREILDRRT
jgi:N-acetyl-alpha-D-glucosaminyl L-malate synthase BshA